MPNKTRGVGLFTAENIVAATKATARTETSPVKPSSTAATSVPHLVELGQPRPG